MMKTRGLAGAFALAAWIGTCGVRAPLVAGDGTGGQGPQEGAVVMGGGARWAPGNRPAGPVRSEDRASMRLGASLRRKDWADAAPLTGVCAAPDGRGWITCSDSGAVRLHGIEGGPPVREIFKAEEKWWDIAHSPDGRFLAFCGGDLQRAAVGLWDLREGKLAGFVPSKDHEEPAFFVRFLPDGRFLTTAKG